MADDPRADDTRSDRAMAAELVDSDPFKSLAYSLLSIARDLAEVRRDLRHMIRNQRRG